MDGVVSREPERERVFGLVCALPEELGSLRERATAVERRLGLDVLDVRCGASRVRACVGGVGKVYAARAAAAVLSTGQLDGLLVVGVCGGLRSHLATGTLVHCVAAYQTDLAVLPGREVRADDALRRAWQSVAPAREGWFLTADRPVLSLWRRVRLARIFSGDCVADMETAAVGAVATGAGVPWAALRAVTDRATGWGALSFRVHYGSQAGRAADTVPELLAHLQSGTPT